MAFDIRNLPFAGTVTRWQSVNCHRYPSVPEHSCLVALYVREIVSRVYPSLSVRDQVLLHELALMHDLSEVVTGDMPSPIKRQLKIVFPLGESPIDRLEASICHDAASREHLVKSKSNIYFCMKLSDILDAMVVIKQEGEVLWRSVLNKSVPRRLMRFLIGRNRGVQTGSGHAPMKFERQ